MIISTAGASVPLVPLIFERPAPDFFDFCQVISFVCLYKKDMSRNYKFHNQDSIYFVTSSVVNWVDLFIRDEYREEIIKSLKFCQQNKGLEIYGWSLMTSHLHMMISTNKNPMQEIMRDFKAYTSRHIRKLIESSCNESRKDWLQWMFGITGSQNPNNKDWQLWQQDNHPIEVYSPGVFNQKLDYIHNNPVTAGFVSKPEDWLYSSAAKYGKSGGLLELSYPW